MSSGIKHDGSQNSGFQQNDSAGQKYVWKEWETVAERGDPEAYLASAVESLTGEPDEALWEEIMEQQQVTQQLKERLLFWQNMLVESTKKFHELSENNKELSENLASNMKLLREFQESANIPVTASAVDTRHDAANAEKAKVLEEAVMRCSQHWAIVDTDLEARFQPPSGAIDDGSSWNLAGIPKNGFLANGNNPFAHTSFAAQNAGVVASSWSVQQQPTAVDSRYTSTFAHDRLASGSALAAAVFAKDSSYSIPESRHSREMEQSMPFRHGSKQTGFERAAVLLQGGNTASDLELLLGKGSSCAGSAAQAGAQPWIPGKASSLATSIFQIASLQGAPKPIAANLLQAAVAPRRVGLVVSATPPDMNDDDLASISSQAPTARTKRKVRRGGRNRASKQNRGDVDDDEASVVTERSQPASNGGLVLASLGRVPSQEESASSDGSSELPARQQLRTMTPTATTLCVRNIPARFKQERLLEVWPPVGKYDFLYHPYSFCDRRTMGFAFVNFTSPEYALEFQQEWHGKFMGDGSSKALDVVAADVQGLQSNLEQLKGKHLERLTSASFLPALFDGTRRLNSRSLLRSLGIFGASKSAQSQEQA